MTAEQFLDFVHRVENEDRWFELARGEVIELPPPDRKMGFVCARAGAIVGEHIREIRRFYVVGGDCGVILRRDPDTVRGPDVAVYDDADSFDTLPKGYGEVPPLFAVEVAHPEDSTDNTAAKIREYLEAGTACVWLIDTREMSVVVYTPEGPPTRHTGEDELSAGPGLPAFRCRVGDLFRMSWESAA